jgi:hypothetical protein
VSAELFFVGALEHDAAIDAPFGERLDEIARALEARRHIEIPLGVDREQCALDFGRRGIGNHPDPDVLDVGSNDVAENDELHEWRDEEQGQEPPVAKKLQYFLFRDRSDDPKVHRQTFANAPELRRR